MKATARAELRRGVLELLREEGPTWFDTIKERLHVGDFDVAFALGSLKAQGLAVYRTAEGWETTPADDRTDAEKLASIREIVSEARSQINTCADAGHERFVAKVGESCPKCNETGYYAYTEVYKLVS